MQRGFIFIFFFFSACLTLLTFLHVSAASAQSAAPPPVYVVDVGGDRIDAARVRAAVARELSVTAVGPDDARASSATGTIDVEASAASKTLRVTFRRQEAPVTRTVALPEDPARAEVAAVFLAGNLARDEARELLGGMKKPSGAPEGPAPASALTSDSAMVATARDDEDLRVLRVTLQSNGEVAARRVRAFEAGTIGVGVVAVGSGVFLITHARAHGSVVAGHYLLGAGSGALISGLVDVALATHPDVKLAKKVAEIEAEGGSSAEVLARIDAAWAELAREARSDWRTAGIWGLVIGSLELGLATTLELAPSRGSEDNGMPAFLFGSAAVTIGISLYGFAVESPFEASYQTWLKVRRPAVPAATRVRPSFGIAPLPGGGALSMGFAF